MEICKRKLKVFLETIAWRSFKFSRRFARFITVVSEHESSQSWVILTTCIQGLELKVEGKMLPNHKFEDYDQDFANMLEQVE